MNLVIWLVIGGVVGWLAGLVMRTDAEQEVLLNVVVGIVGAFVGGAVFARVSINEAPLNPGSFIVSLVGAIILLGLVNVLRRGSLR